ncbi:DUF3185 family protein [Prevotella cerevisiae]|uniref:DUF3185 family protein n=1 Tax=Segatella cerevisiae TaxID=2053716 RepID=A0ABT1BXE5_9BACT|nr:DUF3185 family protein [Segatella cerevisiae]MCO6025654.1 DUF3185 family protein [Segatella cerevisiae]
MKKIGQWSKNIILFFVGIALIIWGYQVNVSNNAKKKVARVTTTTVHVPKTTKAIKATPEPSEAVTEEKPKTEPKTLSDAVDDHRKETTHSRHKKRQKASDADNDVKKTPKATTVVESDTKAEESSGTH